MVCSQYKKADNEFRMFKNDRTDKYTPPYVFSSKQFKMPYLIRSNGTNQNLQHEAPEA